MKNFLQPGNILDLVAPAGGVVSGAPLIIGQIFAIPQADAAVGETFAGLIEGVVEVNKLSTDVVAAGDKLNWNDTNKELQLATSDLDSVATAVEAAGNGVTKVKVKLTPL